MSDGAKRAMLEPAYGERPLLSRWPKSFEPAVNAGARVFSSWVAGPREGSLVAAFNGAYDSLIVRRQAPFRDGFLLRAGQYVEASERDANPMPTPLCLPTDDASAMHSLIEAIAITARLARDRQLITDSWEADQHLKNVFKLDTFFSSGSPDGAIPRPDDSTGGGHG